MKDWLKFTFLGFFNFSKSKEGYVRKFSNFFIGALCFILLFPILLSVGFSFSYSAQANNNKDYASFVDHCFANNDASKRITFEVKDGVISSDIIVNTFDNTDDSYYQKDTYDLLFDTRDSNKTYNDFDIIAKDSAGVTFDYAYEMKADSKYSFEFAYTKNSVNLEAHLSEYIDFLDDVSNPSSSKYNSDVKASYDQIKEKKDSLSSLDYSSSIYELYIKNYYPTLTSVGASSAVPTMFDYYYKEIISNTANKNYVVVLSNLFLANFVKDGQTYAFSGYFSNYKGNVVIDSEIAATVASQRVNDLFKSLVNSNGMVNFTVYFINTFRFSPIVLIAVLLMALVLFIVNKKIDDRQSYLSCVVVVNSFVTIPSIVYGIVGLILSIVLPQNFGFTFSIWCVIGTFVVRSIIEAFLLVKNRNKELEEIQDNVDETNESNNF